MSKMRLCYLGNGQSVHMRNWAKRFTENYEVHLITAHPPKEELEQVTIHTIPQESSLTNLSPLLMLPLRLLKIRRLVNRISPQLIHVQSAGSYALYASLLNLDFIVSAWGSDIATKPEESKIKKARISYILKKASLIHVQDPLGCKQVKKIAGEDKKVAVIPWGVNLSIFHPVQECSWEKRPGKTSEPLITSIFNIDAKRYTDPFSRAIQMVLEEFPAANFLFIGCDRFTNHPRAHFISRLSFSKMPLCLTCSDVFIDPYFPERSDEAGHAYGMSLLEAMACGTPTIAAERPTISQLEGGKKWYHGLTYTPKNSRDLAEKIKLLLTDRVLRRQISTENLEVVKEKFNQQENDKKILQLYQSFIRDSL